MNPVRPNSPGAHRLNLTYHLGNAREALAAASIAAARYDLREDMRAELEATRVRLAELVRFVDGSNGSIEEYTDPSLALRVYRILPGPIVRS